MNSTSVRPPGHLVDRFVASRVVHFGEHVPARRMFFPNHHLTVTKWSRTAGRQLRSPIAPNRNRKAATVLPNGSLRTNRHADGLSTLCVSASSGDSVKGGRDEGIFRTRRQIWHRLSGPVQFGDQASQQETGSHARISSPYTTVVSWTAPDPADAEASGFGGFWHYIRLTTCTQEL